MHHASIWTSSDNITNIEIHQQIYVQQLIQTPENGKDLVSDLENGGHLYVCGGTTMGADVMEAVSKSYS